LYDKGIYIINDLVKEDINLTYYEEFLNKFSINCNFITYSGMVSAIQDLKPLFEFRNIKSRLIYPLTPLFIETLIKCVKGSRNVYRIFAKKNETTPRAMIKWNHVLNLDTKQWKNIYRCTFKTTNDSKLLWLQFRINHRILGTNKLLAKLGKINSPLCTFCNLELETVEHLLWTAEKHKICYKASKHYYSQRILT